MKPVWFLPQSLSASAKSQNCSFFTKSSKKKINQEWEGQERQKYLARWEEVYGEKRTWGNIFLSVVLRGWLFLALCSKVTPDDVAGTIWGARNLFIIACYLVLALLPTKDANFIFIGMTPSDIWGHQNYTRRYNKGPVGVGNKTQGLTHFRHVPWLLNYLLVPSDILAIKNMSVAIFLDLRNSNLEEQESSNQNTFLAVTSTWVWSCIVNQCCPDSAWIPSVTPSCGISGVLYSSVCNPQPLLKITVQRQRGEGERKCSKIKISLPFGKKCWLLHSLSWNIGWLT